MKIFFNVVMIMIGLILIAVMGLQPLVNIPFGGRIKGMKTIMMVDNVSEGLARSDQNRMFMQSRTMFARSLGAAAAVLGSIPLTSRAANGGPVITSTVFLDIKIANYTEESIGRNRPGEGSGRVIFGLYGNDAPRASKQFLSLCSGDGEEFPSLQKSLFSKVTEDGVLTLEKIRGVDRVQIAGEEQFAYRGQIQPLLQPFIETNSLSHDRSGFLTRRQFGSGGEFGISLRENERLNGAYEVFGCVLEGSSVLAAISSIPTYAYKTKTGYSGQKNLDELTGGLADNWFAGQKQFYVRMGQTFGDKRAVDQRGKLLKRVMVTGCGKN